MAALAEADRLLWVGCGRLDRHRVYR